MLTLELCHVAKSKIVQLEISLYNLLVLVCKNA
jgi:hypothetical protein